MLLLLLCDALSMSGYLTSAAAQSQLMYWALT